MHDAWIGVIGVLGGAAITIIGQVMSAGVSNTLSMKRLFFEKQMVAFETLKYKIDQFRTETNELEDIYNSENINVERKRDIFNYAYSTRHLIGEDIFDKVIKYFNNVYDIIEKRNLSLGGYQTDYGAFQRETNEMINDKIHQLKQGFWEYPD